MHFRLVLATCVLLIVGCDEVTSIDATKAQAVATGAIARGWLPDILPRSSTSIKITNNLDLNTSQASFAFHSEEWSSFAKHLTPVDQIKPPFKNWDDTLQGYQSRGYEVKAFINEQSRWIFFCKPAQGRCESVMWLQRRITARPE